MTNWISRKHILGSVLILGVGYFAYFRFFVGEEAKIRELLSQIVRKAETTATESPLTRIQDVRSLASHFTDELEFRFDDGSGEPPQEAARSRKELEQKILGAKTSFRTLEAVLISPSVTLRSDDATAEGEMHVLGSLPDTDGKFYEHHLVTFGLKKVDGTWKISSVSSKNLRGENQPPEGIFRK